MGMGKNAFFIASTGQHVGKTTTCLGLLSGLMKRHENVGIMKPVGQEHVEIEKGVRVDKDVVLFREYFGLSHPYPMMSPVIFPRGFTRDFLDGRIDSAELCGCILRAFEKIQLGKDWTIVEGTGHVGVGSIVELNNARVASLLGINMIVIASGGLGSSFDAIALSKQMCDAYGVKIVGVILNRVLPDKRDMIIKYMSKALSRWDIPILGTVPYDPFLSAPSMKDFEALFDQELLSGQMHRMRHFKHTRLVATSAETYRELISPSQLVITPATRDDIILATVAKYWDYKIINPNSEFETGMILTGSTPPKKQTIQAIKEANIPMLYAPVSSFTAMQMITSFTAKIRKEDTEKVQEAIDLIENHVDFDKLTKLAPK